MTLTDSLVRASDAFVNNQLLIKTASALIILFIGFIIGRITGKLVLKLLKEIEFDKTLRKATGSKTLFSHVIAHSVSYLIYFLTIILSLESLGLTTFVLNMILVVVLVIIGISVVMALKDFIPNFMGGYSLRNKNIFHKGDYIKVGSVQGKIQSIKLLETYIESTNKDLIVIPNAYFIKNLVIKKK